MLAPGNGHLVPRFLDLRPYTSLTFKRQIEHALQAGIPTDRTLVYRPLKNAAGSPAATASAQGSIDRFIAQLRIPTGDITATSITQWHIATVLADEGPQAALAQSGRSDYAQMYRALGAYAPAKAVDKPDDSGISFS